jgi:hypothetical protein
VLVLLGLPAAASALDINYNLNPSWTFNGLPFGSSNCGGPCGCGPCGDCAAPCGAGPCHCFPWYLYWPYEAHFQVPAPTKFPFWPPPMTAGPLAGPAFPMPAGPLVAPGYPAPAGPALPPAPNLLPRPLTGNPQPPAVPPPVQPIGYHPQQQVPSYGFYPQQQIPSYWYGR